MQVSLCVCINLLSATFLSNLTENTHLEVDVSGFEFTFD